MAHQVVPAHGRPDTITSTTTFMGPTMSPPKQSSRESLEMERGKEEEKTPK